jgi:16S rRNA G966 N2-methylase RsmD
MEIENNDNTKTNNNKITNKEEISKKIKNITLDMVDKEMNELIDIGKNAHTLSSRSRIGNNVVDFFTFTQRLETKGKYNISFFEFIERIEEFKKKKFIKTMLTYYDEVKNKNNTKNEYIVLKEVYNICISAINIMRPLNCMEIYTKYNAKRVLNFCAGWGGSTIAAAALNLDAFYGMEINTDLITCYDNMVSYLQERSQTSFYICIGDAVKYDYSTVNYDTVFASPPYYFIEKYANNVLYKSKKEMDEQFYIPVFTKTYNGLQIGGHYIINVCKEIYDNVLQKLLGDAHESFPLKKSKRQNNYTEMVYVWKKTI